MTHPPHHMIRNSILRATALTSLLIVCCLPDVSAQSVADGSIYSRFGVGMRDSYYSSKSRAMGGGGVALRSVDFTNHFNPASLSDQVLTRLSGGFSLERLTSSATGFDDSQLSSGYLSALQISFPLQAGRLGFGASLEPYTHVGYRVDTFGSVVVDPEDQTLESYSTSFRGNGGLQRLSGGIGVLVASGLSLGVRGDFIFGILEESQQTDFLNKNISDGDIISATRPRGLTSTLGIRYVIRALANDEDQLSFGASYTLPVTLSADRVLTNGRGENADTLGQKVSGDIKLPMSLALGMAYQPNPKWTVVADFAMEKWSDFSSDLAFPGYEVGHSTAFRDRIRLSTGVEFQPGARMSVASFLQLLIFRIGAYTDQAYVSPSANEDINSYGFTGSITIPSRAVGTSLDINIEVGRRGTTDFGLIKDRFVRFGVNLNFGERWFDRARFL